MPTSEPKLNLGEIGASALVPLLTAVYLLPRRVLKALDEYDRGSKRDEAIKTVRKRYEDARRAGALNFIELHNVSLYVLLFDEDLCAYGQDFLLANTHRRHRFIARHLASLLYEGSQDLPKLLGTKYRHALRAVDLPGNWESQLNAISGRFNQFKKANEVALKDIRNLVGAHKHKELAKQLETLDRIDPMKIYKLSAEFSGPMSELLEFQTTVTSHLGSAKVMLREIAAHLERQ